MDQSLSAVFQFISEENDLGHSTKRDLIQPLAKTISSDFPWNVIIKEKAEKEKSLSKQKPMLGSTKPGAHSLQSYVSLTVSQLKTYVV